jgi:flagellar hook-basal body complex protein FliE
MVDPLSSLPPLPPLVGPTAGPGAAVGNTEGITKSFGDMLQGYLDNLVSTQSKANTLTNEFIAGGAVDISQVAIAMEESSLAMQLLLEVRNKVLDAYETLLRMPV